MFNEPTDLIFFESTQLFELEIDSRNCWLWRCKDTSCSFKNSNDLFFTKILISQEFKHKTYFFRFDTEQIRKGLEYLDSLLLTEIPFVKLSQNLFEPIFLHLQYLWYLLNILSSFFLIKPIPLQKVKSLLNLLILRSNQLRISDNQLFIISWIGLEGNIPEFKWFIKFIIVRIQNMRISLEN